jgi:beta-lactamase superfamily II metal-dependent hydrolase
MPRHRKKIIDVASAIVILALVTLDVMLWSTLVGGNNTGSAERAMAGGRVSICFFPVTQGESALLVLPNNVTVLTDAGSDVGIVDDLQAVLPLGEMPYIDLAIISYPQSADYDGYEYLLAHYRVGAFIYNGRSDTAHSADWQKLMDIIDAQHIPLITVRAGDRIRYGTAAEIDILSPDDTFAHSPEPSDTGIVQRVITPNLTVLLATDIGTDVENALLARKRDLTAHILKAPFPGLGTGAGDAFLRAVAPKTIVITPGIKNTASAPTKAMMAHLASSTSAAMALAEHGAFLLYNK